MRLGIQTKDRMKENILEEVFKNAKEKLEIRKKDLVEENLKLEIGDISLLENINPELLNHHNTYKIRIDYKSSRYNIEDSKNTKESFLYEKLHRVFQDWSISKENNEKFLVPIAIDTIRSYYGEPPPRKLLPALYKKAYYLCEDILKVRREEEELYLFLKETLNSCSTSNQLKQVWPTSLHKYIPVSKPRKKTKKVELPKVAVPDNLNIRLTENLLET